jgi:hypothetical protein
MPKTILLLVLSLLGGFFPALRAQEITFPAVVDFGPTHTTLPKTLNIPITNDDPGVDLTLLTVFVDGGDSGRFAVLSYPAVIAPASTGHIAVRYTPNAVAFHTTTLQVLSNDADENPASITLLGEGMAAPSVTLSPALDFGPALVSSTSSMNVPLGNAGAAPLTVSDVVFTGGDTGQFSVVSFPTNVAAAASGNIVLQFHPGAVGNFSATLEVRSNDTFHTPTNSVVTGEGIEPDISLPATFDFGQALLTTPNQLTLKVSNTGGHAMTIIGLQITGVDTGQFSVVSFPGSVGAGGKGNIVLRYHPDALTNHTATLEVSSNDPDENPALVQLTGTGVVSRDLYANSGTLNINTQTALITYDSDAGSGPNPPFTYQGKIVNHTATWTFGELTIGNGLSSFVMGGDDRNAIKFIADGQGVVGVGDILIEKDFTLNGVNGAGNGQNGGGRRFGSGAGGNDTTGTARHGESGASDNYARVGTGGGRQANSNSSNWGGGGGGFGGSGGDSGNGGPVGGSWYGRLDLADLGTPSGPVAGSGGGAGNRGSGGSGGGAFQLLALNNIILTPGVKISAEGRDGKSSSLLNPETRRSGGGGSGGGIRLVADSDRDGSGTLNYAGATLSVKGGKADNPNILSEYAGDGGGGRIALGGAAIFAGVNQVAGGDHEGGQGAPGEAGSVVSDVRNGSLSLSGNGIAANRYSDYDTLFISSKSTLAISDTDTLGTLVVSNPFGGTLGGTLLVDLDGASGLADTLEVSGELNLSGVVLEVNEMTSLDDPAYVIAEYGSLVGTFSSANLPTGYSLDYAYDGNQIAVVSDALPGADTDGDGATDGDEVIAGTDPLDAESVLSLDITSGPAADVIRLSFETVVGRTYEIYSRSNLLQGAWAPAATNIIGTDALQAILDTNNMPRTYYRLGVFQP